MLNGATLFMPTYRSRNGWQHLLAGSMMRYATGKKCPSGITTFNGRSVRGYRFSVSYIGIYWRQIYRLEENDSLSSHLDASRGEA